MSSPRITREDLAPVLDTHHGNDALRAAFEGAAAPAHLLSVLGRYVQFNSAFGPGLANLAGEIAARQGLFRDADEPVRILADRAAEVAADFFYAAVDEFDDRATAWRDTHRTLAQATVKGMGRFFGYEPGCAQRRDPHQPRHRRGACPASAKATASGPSSTRTASSGAWASTWAARSWPTRSSRSSTRC